MGIIKRLQESLAGLFESQATRSHREFVQKTRAGNNSLRGQMKPDDNVVGFMFDGDKPRGVVMAVDLGALLSHSHSARKEDALDRQRISACAKAFKINHDLHLMASIYLDNDGAIRVLEGNHRLAVLKQKDMAVVLVNVLNPHKHPDHEFAAQIETIADKCNGHGIPVSMHDPVVYCNVDYDSSGHFVSVLEERQKAPYFTPGLARRPE